MNVLLSARIAFRTLRVNRLRSGLTMLGVMIAVATVIMMVAVGAGAQARVAEQVQSLGSNVINVWARSQAVGGVRIGAGSQPSVTEEDAATIQREIPLVVAAAPYSRGSVQAVYGNQNWLTVLVGVTPEFLPVRNWRVTVGRTISQPDVDVAAKVVLIGQVVAERLFGNEDAVGQVIRIQKVPFTVIGVLEQKGQTTWGQDQDDQVLIPLSTAKRKVLGPHPANGRAVGSISIKIREAGLMKAAEEEIRGVLRQCHRLQPHQEDDFTLHNLTEVLESQQVASRVLSTLLAAIASVSLLVGGIGIMNIMLVSVAERTREIGLRIAVGARARDIVAQFLVEAVMLSLIGGLIGIGVGVAGSYAIAYFAGWQTVIQPDVILAALGLAAAIGILSGFYPARKAAGLDPIEALRHE
jgi:putative ABC transport system permease protein